jgi:hypothetical protein
MNDGSTKNKLLEKDIAYIKETVVAIERKLESQYVTKDELMLLRQECLAKIEPLDQVKKKVDTIVMLILTGVIGALLSLVISK